MSPAVALASSERLRDALKATKRQVVLELTEHVPIDDYIELRTAIEKIGPVQVAVDDAGRVRESARTSWS